MSFPRPLLFSRLFLILFSLTLTGQAATPQETVLYSFQGGPDGANPVSDLAADQQGNLYGTTLNGGSGLCVDSANFVIGCGTVFELLKPLKPGGKWSEYVLYSFQGNSVSGLDSGFPMAGVVFDADGNLYGTTSGITGEFYDNGTVFELSPPTTKGGAWTKTTLYTFQGGPDGANPRAGVVFDAKGNLYGSTTTGAPLAAGTVYRLTHPVKTGAWTETVLRTFMGGIDGQNPAEVTLGPKGNIFGTTSTGGGFNAGGDEYTDYWTGGGTFFELSPAQVAGKPWHETLPFIFPPCPGNGNGGFIEACGSSSAPQSKLIIDAAGNLYGTTELGGSTQICAGGYSYPGCGTVFQLAPPATAGGSWTQNIIYVFDASSLAGPAFPVGALAIDKTGNLYGATMDGCVPWICNSGFGSVFQLAPPTVQGGSWIENTLYQFVGGSDGALPVAGLLINGNVLYSTTQYGGNGNCPHTLAQPTGCGTVFEITH